MLISRHCGRELKHQGKRGMSILVLVLLILFFVAFYAFQHSYNARTRAGQAHKLFFTNSAMNLADSAIQAAILRVNAEMNDPKFSGASNFWYAAFRRKLSDTRAISQDLTALPEVQNLARAFNGKVTELTVSLEAVDRFYDSSGNPESFRDVEKCGSVQYRCVAEVMDSPACVRARQDFKLVHTRHPILNNYAIFVKDAWGEYATRNTVSYPSQYTARPGSFEGYNPSGHNLTLKAASDPARIGKVLLGGPMNSDKKIILNLSQRDTDMMDEVWPGGGAKGTKWSQGGYATPSGAPTMPPGELETLFKSLFYDPANPISSSDWADLLTKTTFLFKKKNCGFASKYTYGKNLPPYVESGAVSAPAPPPTSITASLSSQSALDRLEQTDWIFGSPASNYIAALEEFAPTVSATTTGPPLPAETFNTYNDRSSDADPGGIDLFGPPSARQFSLVEGNVWQRYTSLSVLSMEIKIPPVPPATSPTLKKLNFAVPAMLATIPRDPVTRDDARDFAAFFAFLKAQFDHVDQLKRIFITGMVARAFNAVSGGSGVNYNSEIVVRPYNMGRPEFVKTPLNSDDAAKTLVAPPAGYEGLAPLMSAKNSITYENEAEFFEKCSMKATYNGSNFLLLNLHGNVIIKSDLHFSGTPVMYRGAGVITVAPNTSVNPPVPRNIFIGTHIVKSPDQPLSIMTLYASWGFIALTADNLRINASLMALHPFFNPQSNLYSFIVGPNVGSQGANSLAITGNVCVDRLNLPTFPKFTEVVFDPLFAELGTQDDYFVSVSKKFTYWIKEPL